MDSEFKAFLQKKLGQHIQSVTSIKGGEVNRTFVVATSARRYVIRINTLDELSRFQKEQWCIEKAMELGIKSSPVFDIGCFGNYSYILVALIEGPRGDQPEVNTRDVWQALGGYAKKIHSIGSHGFGEKLEDIQHGDQESWRHYLRYNISSLSDADQLIPRGILNIDQSREIRTYFEALEKAKLQFGLSHGDMSLLNTIVADDGVHLIDWGSAESHVVPHYDLGVILTDSLLEDSEDFRAVLVGYDLSTTGYREIKEDIKSLMLLIAVDKIRWAIDRSPTRLGAATAHFNKVYQWKLKDISPLMQVKT